MKLAMPLRHSIPLLILGVGAAVMLMAWYIDSQAVDRNLLQLAERQLRSNAAFVSGELESAFRNRNEPEARAAVERAINEREVKQVILADPMGIVRFAHDPSLIGEPAETLDLPRSMANVHTRPEDRTGVEVEVLSSDGLVAGRFPVQMRGVERDFLPNEFGALYMIYDIRAEVQRQRNEMVWRMLPRAVLLTALALGFWIAFRSVLLDRINRLVASVRAVARGDFSQEPEIKGKDELAELGGEVATMIQALREQSEQLAFLASHDGLTGLLNRKGIEQEIWHAMQRGRHSTMRHAVCLLDIDSLRVINDTRGHMVGDELLFAFGKMLADAVETAIAVGRVGGDEFVVLLELEEDQDLEAHARELLAQVNRFRFEWDGEQFGIQVSMGLALLEPGMQDPEVPLAYADTACYVSKDRGRGSYAIWQSDRENWNQAHGQMRWVTRIQKALEEDRFELYAQIIEPLTLTASDGLHIEILARMIDEDGALVPPGDFLGAAERYNLVGKIDRWVIGKTLRWLEEHPETRALIDLCSINLSGASFGDTSLLNEISEMLQRSRSVRPGKLCFEVTETAAISNLVQARKFIDQLRALGCQFALDDFGSGLSSFGYLKNLPVDIIKIDGMFVRDICNDPTDRTIVAAVNAIGHEMGMLTIAEFAENEEILDALREIGVDYAQGYAICRPAPLDEVANPSALGRRLG